MNYNNLITLDKVILKILEKVERQIDNDKPVMEVTKQLTKANNFFLYLDENKEKVEKKLSEISSYFIDRYILSGNLSYNKRK